eukprot:CAMPEP_0119434188 /NCGR_PEP_ID=MMETSP1335-20130426/50542_1 /TAXON_ID=259385 /ORGANISM="Chrysoculter rhomboideus, Strain RCC1486" /LENGTH=433 /DNA_ID=CAMNT_0007460043 /DNA_START=196 /DNA_END=1497 /DNA_ORIENTATION=+
MHPSPGAASLVDTVEESAELFEKEVAFDAGQLDPLEESLGLLRTPTFASDVTTGSGLSSVRCNDALAGPSTWRLLYIIIAVCTWYGAHAHSVVQSARLLRDLQHDYPWAHVTLTAVQIHVGVFASAAYIAVSTRIEQLRASLHLVEKDSLEPARPTAACPVSSMAAVQPCALLLLVAAAMCNAVGIAGTNASMVLLGSTHTQVLKASEPIYTALLKLFVLRKASSPLALFALGLIGAGCLTISLKAGQAGGGWLEMDGFLGLARDSLPVLLACIALPLMRVLTKTERLAAVLGSGAHTLFALTAIAAVPALACALYTHSLRGTPPMDMRFLTSAIALNTYMLASLSVLQVVDAVTHAVANAFKRVFIITVSGLFFRDAFDADRLVGLGMSFAGIVLYGEALAPPIARRRLAQRACILAVAPLLLLWLAARREI